MNNQDLSNEIVEQKENIEKEDPFKNLVLKNDVKMPPRKTIRQELLKVSNFTEEEVSIMYWSSLYKAYSLIVRYEQKNVEDYFRSQQWFQDALKELRNNKKKKSEFDYTQFQRVKKEENGKDNINNQPKKESKKKKITNSEKPKKEELKKLKENLKIIKKKVKAGELSILLVNKVIYDLLNSVQMENLYFSN